MRLMKAICVLGVFAFSLSIFAENLEPQSLCAKDDRRISHIAPAGRLVDLRNGYRSGCSAALFGRNCIISAGHCSPRRNTHIEFNITAAKRASDPKDFYPIELIGASSSTQRGNDWAVYRAWPNNITTRWPGDVQGWYPINFNPPQPGDLVRVTGYGVVRPRTPDHRLQQTHVGPFRQMVGTKLHYFVDTEPGNSGSGVIHEATQSIIGVHTNGGCSSRGYNAGTSVRNPDLAAAIKACLQVSGH